MDGLTIGFSRYDVSIYLKSLTVNKFNANLVQEYATPQNKNVANQAILLVIQLLFKQ